MVTLILARWVVVKFATLALAEVRVTEIGDADIFTVAFPNLSRRDATA
jgi:hypothetical protein